MFPLFRRIFHTTSLLPSQIYPKIQLHVPVMCRHFYVLFGRGGTNVMSRLTIQFFDMPPSLPKAMKAMCNFCDKECWALPLVALKIHFNQLLPCHFMKDWYDLTLIRHLSQYQNKTKEDTTLLYWFQWISFNPRFFSEAWNIKRLLYSDANAAFIK